MNIQISRIPIEIPSPIYGIINYDQGEHDHSNWCARNFRNNYTAAGPRLNSTTESKKAKLSTCQAQPLHPWLVMNMSWAWALLKLDESSWITSKPYSFPNHFQIHTELTLTVKEHNASICPKIILNLYRIARLKLLN